MSSTTIVEFAGVTKKYGRGRRQLTALEDVSFRLSKGETLGIVGESGGGKSTICRLAIGIEKPTGGTILVGAESPEHRSQMVFQDPAASLNPLMRVRDCVLEPIHVRSQLSRSAKTDQADEALLEVGLNSDFAERFTRQLSGGQKQRASIGRALVTRPPLIVCDEAVTSLDVSIRAQVLNLLRQLQVEHGLSYMFVSHDLTTVSYMSDRVMVLYLGKVMELATVDQIRNRPGHPYTYILMSAVPTLQQGQMRRARLRMQGEIPSPLNVPPGCRFSSRCPLAADRCREEVPELRDVGDGQMVACHFAPVSETAMVKAEAPA